MIAGKMSSRILSRINNPGEKDFLGERKHVQGVLTEKLDNSKLRIAKKKKSYVLKKMKAEPSPRYTKSKGRRRTRLQVLVKPRC